MPYPTEYSTASADFDRFLDRVKDNAMLQTRHQAWQVARAVFLVFRDHLAAGQALRFADALPPLFRAMLVEGLDAKQPGKPFGGREALAGEVAAIRPDHNFATPTTIAEVALAFRASVNPLDLERALAPLPAAARDYWMADIPG